MVDVSTGSLILIGIATGIGTGIGNPVGQFFYKKYLEPKLEKAHEHAEKIKENGMPFKLPDDNKIKEMLGKK